MRPREYLCSSDEDLEPAAKRRKSEDLLGKNVFSVYSQYYISLHGCNHSRGGPG